MDFNINRINHITVSCPPEKEKEIRWFYEKVMGFKEIEHPSALDQQYKVIWYDTPWMRLHVDLTPPFINVGLSRHFALEVDNIQKARQHFSSHKVTIKEDVAVPYCHRFDVVDPAENYIEIMELKDKKKRAVA